MTFTTLEVELGGLCMLVMRTNVPEAERGLYVLMPDNHHDKENIHCPLFVAGNLHTKSGKPESENLELKEKSDEVDLRFMASHASTPAGLPDFVANVSKFYATPKTVDPECFAGAKRIGLAARVILPLPGAIASVGPEPAAYWVPTRVTSPQPGPGFRTADLYGQCLVKYTVRSDIASIWNYQVKGVELRRDVDTIKMYFVNGRPVDLDGRRYKHSEGDAWEHPQAYHDLLVDGSSKRGPRALIRMDVNGLPDESENEKCGAVDIKTWPPQRDGQVQIRFIDPYTCTLGGGCAPNDPAC